MYTMTAQDSHGTLLHMHGTRPTIEGCNGLTLTTDHNPLTSFSVQPTLSRRQARWSEFLSRFHYVVKYRPGALNPNDSLSRLLAPEEAVASLMVLAVTVSEFNSDLLSRLKAETLLDPHFTDEKCTRKYEHQGTYHTGRTKVGSLYLPPCSSRSYRSTTRMWSLDTSLGLAHWT